MCCGVLRSVAVCCSACSALQCVAARYSVCCSVLQCIAVRVAVCVAVC